MDGKAKCEERDEKDVWNEDKENMYYCSFPFFLLWMQCKSGCGCRYKTESRRSGPYFDV